MGSGVKNPSEIEKPQSIASEKKNTAFRHSIDCLANSSVFLP
jgi:hypothetical protein